MASSSSSSAAVVLDYSDTSQPQYKILNRMSTLFGGKKKSVSTSSSSVFQDTDNDTLVNPISQVDSMFTDEVNSSCVDSMYSSLQSRSSRYRPVLHSDAPAPLRTVQLMDPIVHLPEPTTTPPAPATPAPVPAPPQSPTTATSSQKSFDSPPSPPQEQRKSSPPPGTSTQKIEDVEAQFKLLLVKTKKILNTPTHY